MLDRGCILSLIPHQGAMCLLDRIESWTDRTIACSATSHRDPANPLRRGGQLAAICGVEYGLQAAAAHGALIDGTPQRAGFLVSLRGYRAEIARLDELTAERLDVSAEILAREPHGLSVIFHLRAGDQLLLRGQAGIMIPTQ